MYYQTYQQMQKTLGQLDTWLETASGHAESKAFDSQVLVHSRLAPDQFPLVRQVQIACDTARLGMSRMTGKEAAQRPDTETTLDELRARVAASIEDLKAYSAEDFADLSQNTVSQPRWEGKVMSAHDYFMEHVVPNFFFHATMTYAILRHNGVPLGKKDYLGARTMRSPS